MSFNFEGMMQGLGAGLVNYGEIMKEQDKQKWEEQKELLKYERDARLKKLETSSEEAIAAAKLRAETQQAQGELAVKQQEANSLQGYRSDQTQIERDKVDLEGQKLEVDKAESSTRQGLLAAQAEEAAARTSQTIAETKAMTEADAKAAEARKSKLNFIATNPDYSEEQKMQLSTQVVLGAEIKMAKETAIPAEDIQKVFNSGLETYAALEDTERTKVDAQAARLGLTGDQYYAKEAVKNFVDVVKEANGTSKAGVMKDPAAAKTKEAAEPTAQEVAKTKETFSQATPAEQAEILAALKTSPTVAAAQLVKEFEAKKTTGYSEAPGVQKIKAAGAAVEPAPMNTPGVLNTSPDKPPEAQDTVMSYSAFQNLAKQKLGLGTKPESKWSAEEKAKFDQEMKRWGKS